MPVLIQISIAIFIVSIISLIGNLFLFPKFLKKALFFMIAFSAGALLGAAFLDLLPEALGSGLKQNVPIFILIGMLSFFIIEKFLHWHHHHTKGKEIHAFAYLDLIGDGVHNFTDGIIIAISFMSSTTLGIVTTIAVIAHEIPQEIGDFALLIYGGFSVAKANFFNFLTALTAFFGAFLAYFYSGYVQNSNVYMTAFSVGGFIYIASSDLIPEIHKEKNLKKSFFQFIFLVLGVLLIWLVSKIFENG